MYTENLSIQSFDEELWSSLENEKKRQEEHIELIASEKLYFAKSLRSPRLSSYK